MKLAAVDTNIVSNVESTGAFKIKASAKAFKILSSGLYSDKILAVVRELSCNAYDSHVCAGKPAIPFEVHLPNAAEPWFSVEDFGTGLSKDEIDNVYTTYFESTKTNSNDVIGALGLGSKSPFSYTDSFTVTSIKDGIQCVYAMNLGSNGEPVPRLMLEIETDQANGVKVAMPVNRYDFTDFMKAAVKVFRTFVVKPVVIGLQDDALVNVIKPQEYIIKNEMYGIRTPNAADVGTTIFVQGQVGYRYSDISTYTREAHTFRMMDIFFPIGQLDVTASRESVSFDEATKENVTNHVKAIEKRLGQDLVNYTLEAKTLFDAYIRYGELCSNISNSLLVDPVYDGVTIHNPSAFEFKRRELDGFTITEFAYKTTRRSTIIRATSNTVYSNIQQRGHFFPINKHMYFVNDLGRQGKAILRAFMLDKKIKNAYMVGVNDSYKLSGAEMRECFDFIRKSINGITLINISTLPKPAKVQRAKATGIKLKFIKETYKGYHTLNNYNTGDEMYDTLPATPKYYLPRDEMDASLLRTMIEGLKVTPRVYLLNKAQVQQIITKRKDTTFIHAGDYIKSLFDQSFFDRLENTIKRDKMKETVVAATGTSWERFSDSLFIKNFLGISVPSLPLARNGMTSSDDVLRSIHHKSHIVGKEIVDKVSNTIDLARNSVVKELDVSPYTRFMRKIKDTPILNKLPIDSIIGTDHDNDLIEMLTKLEVTP